MASQRAEIDSAVAAVASIMANLSVEMRRCVAKATMNNHGYGEPHLLGVPAEVRNTIYEYALVEDTPILVQAGITQQPALLQVSRQPRQEAIGIYYRDNHFTLQIQDYDGAAFIPFHNITLKHAPPTRKLEANVGIAYRGRPNWANLLRWIQAVYGCEMWSPVWDWDLSERTKGSAAIATIFQTQADAMRHLPWAQVEKIMEGLRMLLALHDTDWIRD